MKFFTGLSLFNQFKQNGLLSIALKSYVLTFFLAHGLECNSGSYLSNNACVQCPDGSYTLNTGATTIENCLIYPSSDSITSRTDSSLIAGRFKMAAVTLGTKAIFVGGYELQTTSFSIRLDDYDIYDSVSGWSHGKIPDGRVEHSAATINGNLAIFVGGFTSAGGYSKSMDLYSLTQGWTHVDNVFSPRWAMGSIGVKNLAFFVGGFALGPDEASDIVEYFDGTVWRVHPYKLATPRAVIASATDGNIAVFAGGTTIGWNSIRDCLDTVDIYNSKTGLWQSSHLSEARVLIGATNVGSKLFFAGGATFNTATGKSALVDIYSTDLSSWSTTTLPFEVFGLSGSSLGSKAIFIGGSTNSRGIPNIRFLMNPLHYAPVSNHVFSCDASLVPITCSELFLTSGGRYFGSSVTVESAVSSVLIFAGGKIDESPITSVVDYIQIMHPIKQNSVPTDVAFNDAVRPFTTKKVSTTTTTSKPIPTTTTTSVPIYVASNDVVPFTTKKVTTATTTSKPTTTTTTTLKPSKTTTTEVAVETTSTEVAEEPMQSTSAPKILISGSRICDVAIATLVVLVSLVFL